VVSSTGGSHARTIFLANSQRVSGSHCRGAAMPPVVSRNIWRHAEPRCALEVVKARGRQHSPWTVFDFPGQLSFGMYEWELPVTTTVSSGTAGKFLPPRLGCVVSLGANLFGPALFCRSCFYVPGMVKDGLRGGQQSSVGVTVIAPDECIVGGGGMWEKKDLLVNAPRGSSNSGLAARTLP